MKKYFLLPVFVVCLFTYQLSFGQQTCHVEPPFSGWALPISGFTVDLQIEVTTDPPSQVIVEWNFGDGTIQFGNGSHTYSAEGIYEICVTASTMQCSDTYCETVTICEADCPPFFSPLELCNQAAVTCSSDGQNSNVVAAIKDISGYIGQPTGQDLSGVTTEVASWTKAELGEVFGVAYDSDYNIYFTATTTYGDNSSFPAAGPLGYGGIYKVNAQTREIDPTWTVSLPNFSGDAITISESGCGVIQTTTATPGLGNICYDRIHNQLLVTNFEDGAIYVINVTDGSIIDIYNPDLGGNIDNGNDGFAELGERIWGIAATTNDSGLSEIYYSVWASDTRYIQLTSPGLHNTIRRVSRLSTGEFAAGTDEEVIELPWLSVGFSGSGCVDSNPTFSCPVSDIAFSENGTKMLLAERSMHGDIRTSSLSTLGFRWAHNSRVMEYQKIGNSWQFFRQIDIGGVISGMGQSTQNNSAGGIDFGNGFDLSNDGFCDSTVWVTGDYLQVPNINAGVYGMQGFAISDESISHQTSFLLDFNGMTSNVDDKSQVGDVEIFKCGGCEPAILADCSITGCSADTLIINTGYNHLQNIPYNNGDFDNFWELIEAPNPNINLPQPAFVIPTYEPGQTWADQTNTKWISAYPQAQLSENNPEPDPPYTFQNCFCVCTDSSEVDIFMNIYADDFVSVNLTTEAGTELVNLEDHGGFRVNSAPGLVDTTVILNKATYCISAELRNLGAVVTGINIQGYLTGVSLIDPLCCGNTEGTIVGSKFHDRNCDGIRNTVDLPIYPIDEEGIEGWEISLCDEDEVVIATTTTDVTGFYVFNDVPPGNYIIKEEVQTDWEATNIQSQNGHFVTVDTGGIVSDIDFMNKFTGEIELDYDFDCLIADGEFNAITWTGAPCDCSLRINVRECNTPGSLPKIIAVLPENPGSYPWAFTTDFIPPGEYEIIISACDGQYTDVGSCFTVADEPFVETNFSVDGCGLVTFNATVDPTETTGLTWGFNDGSPFESGEEVTHQFVNTNNFHVHLTLTLANGCKKVISINGAVFPDQEFPVITCPEDITIEEFESPTPDITDFATATDDCDDDIYLTYSDETIGECPGTKVITRIWTATDDWGYTATCQQEININCDQGCDASVLFDWTHLGCYVYAFSTEIIGFNGNNILSWTVNGEPTGTFGNPPRINFDFSGTYEVCLTVSDDICTEEFCDVLEIPIHSPPVISCPSDITISADPITCENSTYNPPVSAQCFCDDDPFAPFCNPICTRSDGEELNADWPLGSTDVICIITDTHNASDTCQFTVTVEDTEAPTCTGTDPVTVEGDFTAGGINVDFVALQAFDNCGELDITCDYQSGEFFPCGTTEVICTAIDSYGNSTDCILPIIVDCVELNCCTDTLTFCNRFDQGFQVSSNECNVLFDPIAMDTCDLVQIDWGDGVVENIAGDEFSTHEYNTSGDYQICILAYMPADDGSVCFGKNECFDICVTCDEECENATFGKLWGKSLNDYVSIGEPEADVLYAADKTFVVGGFNGTINFGEPNETDYALSSSGDTDAFLVELDALGNPWNILKIGGDQYDVANSVARDSDGNIYVGGWFRSDTLDIYDGTGAVVQTLANAHGGVCPSTSACHPDIFIAKYDMNFNLIWAERFGSNLIDKLHDLAVDVDDNLIGTGLYSHNEISFDDDDTNPTMLPVPELMASFVFKFLPDTEPKHDWSFALNSNYVVQDAGYTVDTDVEGNIYIGGRFAGEVDFKGMGGSSVIYSSYSDTYQDAFIAKYNPEGKNQWVVDIKGDSLNIPTRLITYDLEVVGDNLYAAGQTGGTGIYFDPIGQSSGKTVDVGIPYSGAFLAKYDIGNGHCQWVNGFDINGKCFNLSVDNQENVVISGFFHRYGNSLDMNPDPNESFILNSNYRDGFLAKYNSSGAFVTAFGALSPNGTSQFQSIDHDEENNLIVVGSNGSNAMDDDPDMGFHSLFNAGTVSDFYVGKFDCSCTPTDTDCCEDLMATIEQIDTCCYAISLQNDYGFSIPRITLDLETEDWNFLTTSLADNYQIVNTSNQRLIIEHNSGSIPSGNLEDIIEICLSTPNMEAASQQQIQLNWYENSAYPGDGRIKPVCSEILETTCNPMDTLTNCLLVVDTLITCMDSTQNEYELRFRVNNFTELDAIALFINDELGNTTFRTCDNPPILASTNLSYSLQPTPLLMGETSEEICLKIAPNQPILESTEICYSLILEGDGGTDCCNEPVQFCFWLEPCCQLCEDNKVVVETLDDCCFALDIQNNCPPNFFTRIETIVLTEGVEFGFIQKGNSEFSFTAISNDTLDWVANSSFLPLGTFEDAIQFCLTGITDSTPTQEVIVNWYAIIPGSIEDSLFCADTLTFNCEPDNKGCLDIYDVEICFVEEFGIYELNFAVQNVADPEFIGGQILISTDQGFAIPNSIISTDLGANDSLIDGSLQFTTNPFPTELDSFEFIFTMKNITGDTCCQEFERLVVAPIPTDDDDCIVNTIELIEQQQILIYPNPFSTGFTIDFSEPITNNYKIKLFDTFGKIVHQSNLLKGNIEIQLQPEGLASGIYFLQISDEVGGLVTKKVVQQ